MNHSRAAVRSVFESKDMRMPGQDLLHDFTLHSKAAAVNDAYLFESFPYCLKKVFLNNAFHVPGLEGV